MGEFRYGILYANGTATLHGALLGCGVGVGDEVIVPSFTPFPTGAQEILIENKLHLRLLCRPGEMFSRCAGRLLIQSPACVGRRPLQIPAASAVLYTNAVPVIVDVDPDTWTMCPKAVEKAISA